MADIKLSGNKKVGTFCREFKETFGCTIRVYNGVALADDNITLASIRKEGAKGGELVIRGNMQVGNLEKKIMDMYGIRVQIANTDNSALADDSLTIAAVSRNDAPTAPAKEEKTPKATIPDVEQPKKVEEKSTPAESFTSSAEDCASAKVRVYGKAQNRTALGIVHAYMVMYPHATLADLRKAFPNTINPASGQNDIFLDVTDQKTKSEWHFISEDEIIKTGDNKKVALVMMWTKPAFEAMVAHARVYDIVVAKFEAVKGGVRGGFRLEYLNGYIPPKPEKKKSKWWLWLILILLLAGIAAFFALRKPKEVMVEKEVIVEKVVYIERIAEIEKNFNAAEFEKGKAELSEDAKFVLHDLAKVLNAHENIKLNIEGHTSAEGDAVFNKKLSEARAKAAVDFLVGREGIDASRLSYKGFGSEKLKNEADPYSAENRRIEFIIVE